MGDVLKKALWLGLLLLVGLPLAGWTQEDTSLIVNDAVEVFFPVGVDFSLTLDLGPDDLSELALVIKQDNRTLRSGRIELDDIETVDVDGLTQLSYFVPVEPDGSWRLFEPVTYAWSVAGPDQEETLEDEFVFEPAGYEWRHDEVERLSFSLFDDNLNVALAGQAVLPAYDLMAEHTGLAPEFLWLVQPKGYSYCPTAEIEVGNEVYACDEETALQFFTQENYRILERTMPGLLPFQKLLVADMFDEFYGRYWRGADVPEWLAAGLEQYYNVTADPYILRQVQEQARLGALFDWSGFAARPDNAEDAAFWAQQAYTLVLYLADMYGAQAPFELAQAVPEAGFEAAFQDIVGDTTLFLLDWERWLFTEAALAAAAWNIYMPETPTPTLLASAIPVTATEAVTISPAIGATVMPSPVPTNTPVPTLPPRPTVAPIPSNTPRPPGSLSQAPTSPSEGSEGGGSVAVCPAALLPLTLLPMAFVAVLNRRKRIL